MPRKGTVPPDWQVTLTPAEASALCHGNPGPDTIREWCVAGKLSAINNGSDARPMWIIPREQFIRDLNRMARETAEAKRAGRPPLYAVERKREA